MCLAGEAERVLMRNKDWADFNGEVFLQQRDEAAVVARSALSDIVGGRDRGACGAGVKRFRMMQVEEIFCFFLLLLVLLLLSSCEQSHARTFAAGWGAAAAAATAVARTRCAFSGRT